MRYGQFCPIAKATEILGEKWTILIVRELLMGARRFSALQRGLGDISPALLTKRLRALEDDGLVIRRRASAERVQEYFLTPAGEALYPVLIGMGEWGLLWARNNALDPDLDATLLQLYLERSVDPAELPGREAVIRFRFSDLSRQNEFWLLVSDGCVELCIVDPGRDVNVFLNCTVRTMHDVWMGERSYRAAIDAGDLVIEGEPALVRNIRRWLKPSIFAAAPRIPWPEAVA
jgi:DNA-binding HxlR family transcriptional regulator